MSPPSPGPQRILITGASGCVGQYIAENLLPNSDAQLLLLLRDPAKLTAVPADHPRITLLVGDLRELDPHAAAIASANRIIHTATAWGDPERARQVNVVAVKELLRLTDPDRLEQVIYFSTASILDRHLQTAAGGDGLRHRIHPDQGPVPAGTGAPPPGRADRGGVPHPGVRRSGGQRPIPTPPATSRQG